MSAQDDETLQIYIEESLEHLADIENDFLAIEERGADLDEELVNKVFRAAHSIKGGAGFMGLNNIRELSHKMENVLGMIRNRELTPNPENINILLLASDALRNLLNDVRSSNETDISQYVEGLESIADGLSHQDKKEPVAETIDISFPGGDVIFSEVQGDISNVRKEGKCIYLVKIDVSHDENLRDLSPEQVMDKMINSGVILNSTIHTGLKEFPETSHDQPIAVLFACVLEPDDIQALLEIDRKFIFELTQDLNIRPITEPEGPSKPVVSKKDKSKITEPATPETKPRIEIRKQTIPPEKEKKKEAKGSGLKKKQPVSETAQPETSLRVKVRLLDSLMNLAGELVLSRNQLLQAVSSKDPHTTEVVSQRVSLITSELQETVMVTRMQPVGNVFNKFPRVVHDLARDLGKNVELILEGKDVELDKTIIEAINDPLTHLVRNSVDHGIESPEERANTGKDQKGKIILRAYHKAGQVNIEISDDGKGLDGEGLAAAALAKGLITEDQTKVMSQKEKVNLILLPGFSTAEKVTDVSGRGVGMDVVKTNLDRLGGQIDIDSQFGKSTTIRIKLPLTLAVIPSQVIVTEGERYAIPQVNLEELLRIPASQTKHRIEKVGDAEVVRLRGKLLPIVKLADVLGVETTYLHPTEKTLIIDRRQEIADRRSRESPLFGSLEAFAPATEEIERGHSNTNTNSLQSRTHTLRGPDDRRYHASSALNIVVVSTGAIKYGMVVDRLLDAEEIVLKPLGRHLKHCKGYAGATIMGNGRVALILDVTNLAHLAGLTSVEGSDRAAEVAKETITDKEDMLSLLLFRGGEEEQFAVPLSGVVRIEKICTSDIENVGGKRIIQYRGRSLPLFAIHEAVDVKPLALEENALVIVFILAQREIGLLVNGPVDAVDISVEVDDKTLKQPGIMGSVIIDEQTTLLVDIHDLVHTLNPEWFSEQKAVSAPDGKTATILVVEDSKFFRNQVRGFIEDAEYHVIDAEDGLVAWDLLQEYGDEISLVVTDIEMPNLDGVSLTKKIRADKRFSDLPVIALTTLASDEEVARGKAAGIDDYQIKLDKEKLMESVYNFLKNNPVVNN
jgi:two-component system chemotaxis sensor kinase CheA